MVDETGHNCHDINECAIDNLLCDGGQVSYVVQLIFDLNTYSIDYPYIIFASQFCLSNYSFCLLGPAEPL